MFFRTLKRHSFFININEKIDHSEKMCLQLEAEMKNKAFINYMAISSLRPPDYRLGLTASVALMNLGGRSRVPAFSGVSSISHASLSKPTSHLNAYLNGTQITEDKRLPERPAASLPSSPSASVPQMWWAEKPKRLRWHDLCDLETSAFYKETNHLCVFERVIFVHLYKIWFKDKHLN